VGSAHAATKLCVPRVKDAPIVDVSKNPRLIVKRSRLEDLEILDGAPGSTRTFTYSVEPIDEYWASVTVKADVGDIVFTNDFAGYSCGGLRFRVVPRARAAVRPIAITKTSVNSDGGKRYVWLRWNARRNEQGGGWTRLDWAFDRADLEAGLHGSRYADDDDDTYLVNDGTWRIAFVRLVHFGLDGSTSTWSGWIDVRADGTIAIGSGPAPVTPVRTSACDAVTPRPVPVDPTFYFSAYDTPRFIAASSAGTKLSTKIETDRYHNRVSVPAPAGTVFQLQPLPRPLGCSTERWLRATDDRSHDEPPVVVRGDNRGCAVHVELADPYTWGLVDVVTSRATYGDHTASDVGVTGIGEYDDAPIRVRITPAWGNLRGHSWDGWIQVEPRCEGIRFWNDTTAPQAALTSSAPPAQESTATQPPSAPAVARCSATARAEGGASRSLRAVVAALGLMVLAFAMRPRLPTPR
jgi:hypothetical protein